jgi:transposase
MTDYFTRFLGIQGFIVKAVTQEQQGWRSRIIVDIVRERPSFVCSECGHVSADGVEYRERVVQHLTCWQHLTYLRFQQYRVKCPRCGLRVEALPFVERYSRVSVMLGNLVYELCKVMTNKAVGILLALDDGTVKTIDNEKLQAKQAARPLDGICALGVDEIFIGSKTCLHLVSALDGPRGPELLYIGEGRKEKDLKRFWKWFGKERTALIKVGVMDMWKGFINSFKANCPGIIIMYDKFHVAQHLLNALNKVRQQELRRVGERLKGLFTGKKFILLSRLAHVRGKARESLNELLCASPRLQKAHLLKESFGHLWSYRSRTWARKFWNLWKDSLKWARLKPYDKFVGMVDRHLDGILAYCDHKLSLGFIEATNLKAKNIIRRAYGYQDDEYMKLKIIQACSSLKHFQPWTASFNNSG